MFAGGYVGARNIATVLYWLVRNGKLTLQRAIAILCGIGVISACITGADARVDIAVWSFHSGECSAVKRS
jgi:hypothetical protein